MKGRKDRTGRRNLRRKEGRKEGEMKK